MEIDQPMTSRTYTARHTISTAQRRAELLSQETKRPRKKAGSGVKAGSAYATGYRWGQLRRRNGD